MQRLTNTFLLIALLALVALAPIASEAAPAGGFFPRAFTYQGQLNQSGIPHDGAVELTFTLWDSEDGGSQFGNELIETVESVSGLFQVELDFGHQPWDEELWLQIEVDGQILSPRQPITAVPLASMALDVSDGRFWRQGGDSGTGSGDFLGTTDNAPFEIRVDGLRALRIEPSGADEEGPNIIAGDQANHATAGTIGATIAGGGYTWGANQVSADYTSIGGGEGNSAAGSWSTIGGGIGNTAGGGSSTIAGGSSNSTTEIWSTIGGGSGNTASGSRSTVPGGSGNESGGSYSFAAGRRAKAMHDGAFVWADATNADFSSVSANEYAARASGGVRLAVGNGGWQIQPSGATDEAPNVIAGHATNEVSAGVIGATISGGGRILGTSFQPNSITGDYGVVSGGVDNRASWFATTSGGRENFAADSYATVGGGRSNTAVNIASTVGGGNGNTALGWRSTVAGGFNNSATATTATVNGGDSNNAEGTSATIPGGANNTAAGNFSFAAGRRANSNHDGAFVWADSTDADFASTGTNQFAVRATGGVGFGEAPSDYFVINTPFGSQDTDYSFGTGALRVRINGATRFRVLGNGGVAIGSSYQTSGVPERGMRVSGVVELATLGTGGTEDLCRNTSDGAISTCSSSRRYKQDIRELEIDQRLLEQLRPVRFRWIDSGNIDIGLIAEEVAEIDPRLVTVNTDGQIEGVKYRQLSAVLIRALQEQGEQTARVQSELAGLKKRTERMDELAERNARLEARLLRLERLLSETGQLALEY